MLDTELAAALHRCTVAGVLPTLLLAILLLPTLSNGLVPFSLRPRLLLGLALAALALAGRLLPVAIALRPRLLRGLTLVALTLPGGLLPVAVALRLLPGLALLALALAGRLLLASVRLWLWLRLLGLTPLGLALAALTGLALTALALGSLRLIPALRHSLPRLAFTATLRAAWRPLALGRAFLLTATARHVLGGRKHSAAQNGRRGGTDEQLTSHGDGSSLSGRCPAQVASPCALALALQKRANQKLCSKIRVCERHDGTAAATI